jgi:hypothetical protein
MKCSVNHSSIVENILSFTINPLYKAYFINKGTQLKLLSKRSMESVLKIRMIAAHAAMQPYPIIYHIFFYY